MRAHVYKLVLATLAGIVGFVIPPLAQAQGGYLGVDVATRWTDLDWGGGTDHYTTNHVRLKGGFDFDRNFGFEMRIASGGDDTFNDFAGTWRWRAGTAVSGYFRPHVSLSPAFDLYGLLGMTLMDTTYELIGFGEDHESVLSFDFGGGGQFNVSRNVAFTLEITYSVGSADYPLLTTGADLYGTTAAAGVLFRF